MVSLVQNKWQNPVCVICNKKTFDKKKKKISVITICIRKDNDKTIEFAKRHKGNGTKYAAAACRTNFADQFYENVI